MDNAHSETMERQQLEKLGRELELPHWLHEELVRYKNHLSINVPLLKLIRHFTPGEEITHKNIGIQLDPIVIGACYPSGQVYFLVRPSKQDQEKESGLSPLQKTGHEVFAEYQKGVLGFIEGNVMFENKEPVLVIPNAQHRKPYFGLDNRLKKRYDGWFKSAFKTIRSRAAAAGIARVYFLTPLEAEARLRNTEMGQNIPRVAQNEFYIKWPKFEGNTEESRREVEDIFNGKSHSIRVWVKPG